MCLLRGMKRLFKYYLVWNSAIAPCSSSPTCRSYQKDKSVELGNLQFAVEFRKLGSVE